MYSKEIDIKSECYAYKSYIWSEKEVQTRSLNPFINLNWDHNSKLTYVYTVISILK